ncbi:MAG: KH domain-containing protein [Patescibacteria group bacterium]
MSEKYQDQEFLENLIKSLVDNPNDVKLVRTVDEMGVLMTLDVNPADMGKIIGRMGNTAKAIRTLLRVVGMKHNARVNLKINEPAGSPRMTSSAAPASNPMARSTSQSVDDAMNDIKS